MLGEKGLIWKRLWGHNRGKLNTGVRMRKKFTDMLKGFLIG